VTEIAFDDSISIPIPDWFHLDITEIYNNLNSAKKKGQYDQQHALCNSAMGIHRKTITSIGIIANHLLRF
jgi:hypothetical protein